MFEEIFNSNRHEIRKILTNSYDFYFKFTTFSKYSYLKFQVDASRFTDTIWKPEF